MQFVSRVPEKQKLMMTFKSYDINRLKFKIICITPTLLRYT